MNLIDRDALIEKILDEGILGNGYSDSEREDDVIDMIESCHTVDAVPLKHGKWELNPDFFECLHIHRCSYCKKRPLYKQNNEVHSNYCPNCGAKMDGDQHGTS